MLWGSHIRIWHLANHEKNETKNIRLLVLSFSSTNLAFWCFLFCFFMWFARFQISICEPQIIWRKLLVLSWPLYHPPQLRLYGLLRILSLNECFIPHFNCHWAYEMVFCLKIVLTYCHKKLLLDQEKLLKNPGWRTNMLRSLKQFIRTVKGQNNFWNRMLF